MTEKLYYQNQYQSEFKAVVTNIEKIEQGWAVTLNRTQFYPEGGGQPSDRGWINDIPLLDVRKSGDDVVHLLPQASHFSEGETVMARVDWSHRFDYMQQHTAQHILSAVLHRTFGIGTVAVHLGADILTIETDREYIDEKTLERLDHLAQEIVCTNIPLDIRMVEQEDIAEHDLRRTPKVSGLIRIVKIGDFDAVACGGVHCSRTGEVKLLRRIGTEKIRGHLRIAWKAGNRAFEDYRYKIELIASLSDLHSVKESEIAGRNSQLIEELQSCRYRMQEMMKRQAALEARQLAVEAVAGLEETVLISSQYRNEEKDFLRAVADNISENKKALVVLTNHLPEGVQWLVCAKGELTFPFNRYRNELLLPIDGKGGGKPPLWQGIGKNSGGIESFISACVELLRAEHRQ